MYTRQQVEAALELYEKTGSVSETIASLGYPSKAILYQWIERRTRPESSRSTFRGVNTPEHPRHPPAQVKMQALYRCFELGEDVKTVAEEIGYSRASIYAWRSKYLQSGAQALVNENDHPRGNFIDGERAHGGVPLEQLMSMRQQLCQMSQELSQLRGEVERLRQEREGRPAAAQNRQSTARGPAAWQSQATLSKVIW